MNRRVQVRQGRAGRSDLRHGWARCGSQGGRARIRRGAVRFGVAGSWSGPVWLLTQDDSRC
jgi:hypothetical protein